MLSLKAEFKQQTGKDYVPSGAKGDGKKKQEKKQKAKPVEVKKEPKPDSNVKKITRYCFNFTF